MQMISKWDLDREIETMERTLSAESLVDDSSNLKGSGSSNSLWKFASPSASSKKKVGIVDPNNQEPREGAPPAGRDIFRHLSESLLGSARKGAAKEPPSQEVAVVVVEGASKSGGDDDPPSGTKETDVVVPEEEDADPTKNDDDEGGSEETPVTEPTLAGRDLFRQLSESFLGSARKRVREKGINKNKDKDTLSASQDSSEEKTNNKPSDDDTDIKDDDDHDVEKQEDLQDQH
jgi:hypothetical protein